MAEVSTTYQTLIWTSWSIQFLNAHGKWLSICFASEMPNRDDAEALYQLLQKHYGTEKVRVVRTVTTVEKFDE